MEQIQYHQELFRIMNLNYIHLNLLTRELNLSIIHIHLRQ